MDKKTTDALNTLTDVELARIVSKIPGYDVDSIARCARETHIQLRNVLLGIIMKNDNDKYRKSKTLSP